jgi:hypothetical protein
LGRRKDARERERVRERERERERNRSQLKKIMSGKSLCFVDKQEENMGKKKLALVTEIFEALST